MPMTDVMVLMAATPSQPAASAVRAGYAMSVMLGVILAHTGLVALALIQPHTSCVQSRCLRVLAKQSLFRLCFVSTWKEACNGIASAAHALCCPA